HQRVRRERRLRPEHRPRQRAEEPARHGRRTRWDPVLRRAEPRPDDLQSALWQRLDGPVRCRRQSAVSRDPRHAPTISRRHHRRRVVPVPDRVQASQAVTRHPSVGVRRRVGDFAAMLLTDIPTLDAILHEHASALGPDYDAYRNHTYRVVNACAALSRRAAAQLEKLAIAVAFHDLGIWTDDTFDYLAASMRRARAHLAQAGKSEWADEVDAMILEHHKVRPYKTPDDRTWIVEPLRKADLVDLSLGL